jgi:predicted metal-dependent hydrolase
MVINQIFKRKEEKSSHNFQYGDKVVEYTLIKTKRRKTCEVIVDRSEIILRAPFDISIKEIENLLNEKINWISQKQKEIKRLKPDITKPVFENGSTLPFLGNNYILEIVFRKDQKDELIFENNKFIAYLDDAHNSNRKGITENLYFEWLNSKANEIFKEKIDKYGKIIGVNPKGVAIKNLKNRWGSLSKNKTLNLNIHLIKAPEDIINYIIIHELCHLRIQGHSFRFWNYLKQFVPDYEQKIKWLDRNTNSLL